MALLEADGRGRWTGSIPFTIGSAGLIATAALAAGGVVGLAPTGDRELLASPETTQAVQDQDDDGAPDVLETQYGSSPLIKDTDADGVPDLVEIVHGTRPDLLGECPSENQLDYPTTKTLGYIEGDYFHLLVAIYEPTATYSNVVGAEAVLFAGNFNDVGPTAIDLSGLVLTGDIAARSYDWGGGIIQSDSVLPLAFVDLFPAHPSQYADPSGFFFEFTVAFTVTFSSPTSPTLQVSNIGLFASADSNVSSLGMMEVSQGLSGAFRPLQPITPPPGWESEKACFVSTDVVATDGPVVTVEATSASCQDMAGGFCSGAACAQQVGRQYKTIDPMALGG